MTSTAFPFPARQLPSLLALAISVALCPAAVLAQSSSSSSAASTAAAQAHRFEVAAQPLDSALTRLADQAGVRILFASGDVAGAQGKAVNGHHSVAQALDLLLAGTGLQWRWREPGVVAIEPGPGGQRAASDAIVTDALSVDGRRLDEARGAERDVRGYDDVYDLDLSTGYSGRERIERYKGLNPADVVKDLAGVYSGDARNGGALDVSIRGIQGPGRVPVIIDGTEQALTVWRGYNGISNRSYIDPNLIGGIQVLKGPSMVRDVHSGVGGAMVIRTLDVADVLEDGETFGGEVLVESGSNAVAPRVPGLLTGQDYRDVPGFPSMPNAPYDDPSLRITPASRGKGLNVFDGEDVAWRAALGWRPSERVDVMLAYAYRDRGNYFSGTRGADYYQQTWPEDIWEAIARDQVSTVGNRFLPGNEVPNTSSRQESWLFKTDWRITDSQALRLTYRDSLSNNGDILPTRINTSSEPGSVQWPLSSIDAKAYSLEYKLRPAGQDWLDLSATLWNTTTRSDTYTSGGFPNFARGPDDPLLRDTAIANADHRRNGLTLSNRFTLTETLALTVGGRFEHEKLRSDDRFELEATTSSAWRMLPRAGRREEWEGNLNLEWRPNDVLAFNVGVRRTGYWAFDDFMAANPSLQQSAYANYQASYMIGTRQISQAEVDASIAGYEALRWYWEMIGVNVDQMIANARDSVGTWLGEQHTLPWAPDVEGNFSRATNPCLNGQVAAIPGVVPLFGGSDTLCQITRTTDATTVVAAPVKQRGHGWRPTASLSINVSDVDRLYFRYAQALRYPSMFESTAAFSASYNPLYPLKPERVANWEVGYVRNFAPMLPDGHLADIKLVYFSTKTRDVIERDEKFFFENIDKQTIRGLEFQGRYDNTRFFTDLGLTRILENEVCDESAAVLRDMSEGLVPNCVQDGFIGQYLLTQATPKLSINLSLGLRLLDGRLELGTRVVHHRRHENPDLEQFRQMKLERPNLLWSNVPFTWDEVTTVDAYASYRLGKRSRLELVGTNLRNEYYVDPATRSTMPAPGRTLRIGFSTRF